jgi:hypothetical protein
MRNTGVRNPEISVLVCLAIAVASALSIAWGVHDMRTLGHETFWSAIKIGPAIATGIIGLALAWNFLIGIKVIRAARRGVGEVARWTVTAGELDDFRTDDKARNAYGPEYRNDYKPPRTSPPEGIEVIFVEDGVLVGDTYFGLPTTGMYRFAGVQMLPSNPLAIEFGTVLTWMSKASTIQVHRSVSVLRVPISRLGRDAGVKVLEHFRKVDAREVIVKGGHYRRVMRISLILAGLLFATAALGFWFNAIGAKMGNVPLFMAVIGVVAGLGALVLANIAWVGHMNQHQKPGGRR